MKPKIDKIEITFGKKEGHFYCVITDKLYPYTQALAYGKDIFEAEKNAWELRNKILKAHLKTTFEPILIDDSPLVK